MMNLAHPSYPVVHVVCKTVSDIQNAVRFAKKHNLHVTIKSTGVEFWGRSSAHGSFSINLMEMKHISVNTATTERIEHGELTVQTGATFSEIYAEVEKHNRIVVGASSHNVGPGGWIAGGGFGPLTPSFGLGIDNVLEIKVVLADGRVATCTRNETVIENNGTSETRYNGDLFWALRGDGGGTFGVVVHYVLRLYPAPTSVYKVKIRATLYQNGSDIPLAKLFLEKYANWMSSAPFHWGSSMWITSTVVVVNLRKNGPFVGNEERELQPFYHLKSLYPTSTTLQFMNYSSIGSSILPEPSHARTYETGAFILAEQNNESLWNLIANEVIEKDNSYCFLGRLGGKTRDYDKAWSSVHTGFRRAQSILTCGFTSPLDKELSTFEKQEKQKLNAANFAEKVRKFGDGNYVNVGYVPIPDWKVDFWGENYVDLLKVKIKYDPDNLFYCYHCVGSDMKIEGGEFESSEAPTNVAQRLPVQLFLVLSIFMGFI